MQIRAQSGGQGFKELVQRKGLAELHDGSNIRSMDVVVLRGEHDRDPNAVLLQPLHDFEASDAWHSQVEHDDVGQAARGKFVYCYPPIVSHGGGPSCIVQHVGHHSQEAFIILDDQNTRYSFVPFRHDRRMTQARMYVQELSVRAPIRRPGWPITPERWK
jgi:hypothetical protein